MPFHYQCNNQKLMQVKRKEKDSFFAHHFDNHFHSLDERVSVSASKGSITPEAALSFSFFILAIVCMVYIFEIMAVQTSIKSALHAVAKEVAAESYVNPVVPIAKMEQQIVKIVGKDRLDRSLIVGGSKGLDCSGSKKYWNTTIMDLQVEYQIEIPVAVFRIPILRQQETLRVKGWTGYEERTTGNAENTMVYITEYGLVYHADKKCSYLDLSVKTVDAKTVSEMRNENGEKYKSCPSCRKHSGSNNKIYVTEYGNKYHKSLDCSALQRKIYAISINDVHGLGGCSKCVR